MRYRLTALILTMSLLSACSDSGSNPDGPQPSAAVPTVSPEGPHRPAIGAWAQPTGGHNRDRQMAAVTQLEADLGHKLAIDHFYVTDFAEVRTWDWRLQWDLEEGRIPMISMGSGADTQLVASGMFDPQLESYAEAIADSGAERVLIRYAFEMDGALNRDWVRSGPDFIRAWQHVRSKFEGLPVEWVWSPNAPAFDGTNGGVDQYWPGDDQVDWIAADGYNFYTCADHRYWKSFDEIFTPFLEWAESKEKPLMLAEFGSLRDPEQPARQAEWIADSVSRASTHPQLKALVYFNSDGQGCDWRLDSSDHTNAMLPDLGLADQVAELE
ncbi:glycoside hydrolase family 26 protein [Kineosporia babensis]|uniref:GH26 domain-containing protein n=1 Tax=Kineosporia babensis TaxID=499548 RepID=A0A9X1NJK3_9ACTN|nr:hypothetical protein [Kineosporia babensis]MCD5315353.1 hypothetical protein [Kineosporia babensis]